MKLRKMSFVIFCFTACFFLVLVTLGGAMMVDKSKWPQRSVIGGSVLGGPDYVICNGIANILTKKLDLVVTVQATAGNVGNFRMTQDGKCELAITSSGIFMEGIKGTGWTKGKKYENVRLLTVLYPKTAHFWTPAGSGIKNIMDLNGKRVNLSKAGSTADLVGRRIFKFFDIKPAKITSVSHGDANNLLRDGLLDAAFTVGFAPHPAISEISLTNAIRVVDLTAEQSKKFLEQEDHMAPAVIPKGTYKGVDYEVHSVSDNSLFITRKDLPPDFAYMVTKTILENLPMLKQVHKSFYLIQPENIKTARVPLAQGAYEYYKEKGLSVPKAAMPR